MKRVRRGIAVFLCVVLGLVNSAWSRVDVYGKEREVTLSDGTVLHQNWDGSTTATIKVDRDDIEQIDIANQTEDLQVQGSMLSYQGEDAQTEIADRYEAGKDLVHLTQDGLGISFYPIVEEREEAPVETEVPVETEEFKETNAPAESTETAGTDAVVEPEEAAPFVQPEAVETKAPAEPEEAVEITEPAATPEAAEVTRTAELSESVEPVKKVKTTKAAKREASLKTWDILGMQGATAETGEPVEAVDEKIESRVKEDGSSVAIEGGDSELETGSVPEGQEGTGIAPVQEQNQDSSQDPNQGDSQEAQSEQNASQSADVDIAGQKIALSGGSCEKVRYDGLFYEGVQVELSALKTGVKEEVILQEYVTDAVFSYGFSFQGLIPEQDGKRVVLKDMEGAIRATIAAPFMLDANGVYSDAISVTFTEGENGDYVLTYRPDDAWLATAAYPVVIDPTVQYDSSTELHIEDNYVTGEQPGTNHYFAGDTLKVGNDSTGTHMAYVRPVIPDSIKQIASNAIIQDAWVNMYEYSGRNSAQTFSIRQVLGGEWTSRDITYANAPTFSGMSYETKQVNGGGWTQWNLKPEFSNWFNTLNQQPNYGFVMNGNGGGAGDCRLFYSSDAPTNALTFSLRYYIDIEQPQITAKAHGNGENSGTGYVDLSWNAIPGAEAYYVGIFNGESYEYFFQGNKRSFTTKGKKLWPTQSQIDGGRYKLHNDGKGGELPMIPAFTYRNVKNGSYDNSINYYFRILPANSFGQAPNPGLFPAKTVKLPDTIEPNRPTAIKVNPADYSNQNSVTVSWSGISDYGTSSTSLVTTLTGGRIEYSVDNGKAYTTGKRTASGTFPMENIPSMLSLKTTWGRM